MEKLRFKIDKDGKTPLYRQISHKIITMLHNGELLPGEKLPAEREFAELLGTARGTVTKAYAHLSNNKVIELVQGRGCFVSKNQNVILEGEKERAIEIITTMVDSLEQENFSHKEIETLFGLVMMERAKSMEKLKIAFVDCNPEGLSIFRDQLSYITKTSIDLFLLEDIYRYPRSARQLASYDVIITTNSHYDELTRFLPNVFKRILQVSISPSQQTIIDITSIKTTSNIGIVCRSKRFQDIVEARLKSFQIKTKNIPAIFESQAEERLSTFLRNLDVLIVAPNSPVLSTTNEVVKQQLALFKGKGGVVLTLNYQVERGSLIYIEEQLSKRFTQKNSLVKKR